jgi:hypothetical protein
MDVLGMRALTRLTKAVGGPRLSEEQLREMALVGDVVANSLYYSLVAVGRPQGAWVRGAALGLAAGIGAVVLPGPMGLGRAPSNHSVATRAMTVGWYVLGGLAAAGAYRLLRTKPTSNA